MQELDDHFKEQVKMKPAAIAQVSEYLVANAGDTKTSLQRITNTPYFKEEHRFLNNRILDDWVGTLANCTACHVGAWVGDYRE